MAGVSGWRATPPTVEIRSHLLVGRIGHVISLIVIVQIKRFAHCAHAVAPTFVLHIIGRYHIRPGLHRFGCGQFARNMHIALNFMCAIRFAVDKTAANAVLDRFTRREAGRVSFDHVMTRKAGARRFVNLHMHLPPGWMLRRAADLRQEVERALMQAVPGLYVSIQMLPDGVEPLAVELDAAPADTKASAP